MKNDTYEKIYYELYEVVREALSLNIVVDRIKGSVQIITEEFTKNPYNELLLYFYTQSKENYLNAHITNNVILALGFGRSLSLSQEDLFNLGLCAFAHDIAMAEYLPLFQKGGNLSDEETRLIRNHTKNSADIFQPYFPEKVIQGILDTHEQVDGGGYPEGKTGMEISLLAKIVSICDVFEALTHVRNFRAQLNPYEAIKLIIQKKDIVFDGMIVNRFVDFLSIYPVGTLVHLNTGEIALVVGSNLGFPTRCICKVLLNAQREPQVPDKFHDLLQNKMIYVTEALNNRQEQEVEELLNPRSTIQL